MRSATPKMLHPVCGRPLIAWPIAAAREAGAERVAVIISPGRDLSGVMPEGTETIVQPEPDGTGGAVRAGLDAIAESESVLVLPGDHPLISAEVLRGLVDAHRGEGAAATVLTTEMEDPGSYGRIVRDSNGDVQRIAEAKAGAGDAITGGARDPRGQQLDLRIRRRRARRRAPRALKRQRPGRVLPGRRAAADPRGRRPCGRPPGGRPPCQPRHQRPRRPRAGGGGGQSPHRAPSHARRRDHRRPGHDLDRRRRGDRRRRSHRARFHAGRPHARRVRGRHRPARQPPGGHRGLGLDRGALGPRPVRGG